MGRGWGAKASIHTVSPFLIRSLSCCGRMCHAAHKGVCQQSPPHSLHAVDAPHLLLASAGPAPRALVTGLPPNPVEAQAVGRWISCFRWSHSKLFLTFPVCEEDIWSVFRMLRILEASHLTGHGKLYLSRGQNQSYLSSVFSGTWGPWGLSDLSSISKSQKWLSFVLFQVPPTLILSPILHCAY